MPEFRNKLGWLVGNIFSRIGTPDWSEKPGGKKAVDEMTARLLKEHGSWVAEAATEAAREAGVNIDRLPPEEIARTLERHLPPAPREQVLACVKDVFSRVLDELLMESPEEQRREAVRKTVGAIALTFIL